jgi:hypothetical protein
MILRERLSAKAIAYRRTSPLVIGSVEHKGNTRIGHYVLCRALQSRLPLTPDDKSLAAKSKTWLRVLAIRGTPIGRHVILVTRALRWDVRRSRQVSRETVMRTYTEAF